jgi:hypothetical protein
MTVHDGEVVAARLLRVLLARELHVHSVEPAHVIGIYFDRGRHRAAATYSTIAI